MSVRRFSHHSTGMSRQSSCERTPPSVSIFVTERWPCMISAVAPAQKATRPGQLVIGGQGVEAAGGVVPQSGALCAPGSSSQMKQVWLGAQGLCCQCQTIAISVAHTPASNIRTAVLILTPESLISTVYRGEIAFCALQVATVVTAAIATA